MSIFEFKEGRYVKRIYFLMASAGDLMGCLYRDGDEGPWTLDWRVRYYNDDKAFDSADERSAHRAVGEADKLEEGRACAKFSRR